MDCLTFIARIFDAAAWPVAAVAIAYGLREQLNALMPLIKKFKAGPVELELEHIKKDLDDAKAQAASAEAKANVIAEKFDEGGQGELATPEADYVATEATSPLSETEAKVLKAMCESRFATRTISGVAKDAQLTKAAVQVTYGSLISKGLVDQTTNKDGQPRWFVTSLGRTVANEGYPGIA